MQKKYETFQRGRNTQKGGVIICSNCGKKTRETGYDESSYGMCKKCIRECESENERSDGRHRK